jgi:hypothetical protein
MSTVLPSQPHPGAPQLQAIPRGKHMPCAEHASEMRNPHCPFDAQSLSVAQATPVVPASLLLAHPPLVHAPA